MKAIVANYKGIIKLMDNKNDTCHNYKMSDTRYANDSLHTVNVISKDIVVGVYFSIMHALMYDCGIKINIVHDEQ